MRCSLEVLITSPPSKGKDPPALGAECESVRQDITRMEIHMFGNLTPPVRIGEKGWNTCGMGLFWINENAPQCPGNPRGYIYMRVKRIIGDTLAIPSEQIIFAPYR